MWFVVLLAAAANAVTLSAPTVTVARDIKASARPEHPETTAGPATLDDLHLLDRRDTLAQADATVCGYYNRAIDNRLYCLNNNACVFYAPDSEFPGMVGCCPQTSATEECIIFSTCIDIDDILATSDLLAQTTDSMALFCTYDENRYCHTRTWPSLNAADFECTSTSSRWIETMYTYGTVTDEEDVEDQTTETLSFSWISSSDLPTARSADATTTTETETETDTPTTSTSGGSTPSPVDEETPIETEDPDKGSSTPVGAIVGGVVGGVGGLALVAGALFLYRRHKKKSAVVDTPVIPPPETKQQPGISTKEMFAPPQGASQGAGTAGMHEVQAEPMYAELPVQEAREQRVMRHELE
ncbi:hypothetical protein BJX68DRAFT_119600 [Aspergillus pseudodeflectus]|uniref:LPXTG-domain-containing protein n=1 Tax=Aspergillus pseudodeflectus TaxID=176178 RepID=A0ABR4K5G2_9EURO